MPSVSAFRSCRTWPRSSRTAQPGLLALCQEVGPTVFGPAVLVVLRAKRALLAIADDRNPVGGDPERDEVVHRGFRPTLTEREVVLVGAALIGVPFNKQKVPLVFF